MKILVALVVLCLLSGCGHNVFSYMNGKYANVGYDPQTQKLGIQYGNGDVVNVVEKDNAEFEMEVTDTFDVNGRVTSKTTKITYKIEEQATQADVDLKKAENNKDED